MTLPLLEFAESLFPNINLENTAVIACQHILETNYLMFERMFNRGLDPKNTFLLGKCYSTNLKVMKKFQDKGVFVHNGSIAYDSYNSFDEQFEKHIIDFIKGIKEKIGGYEKIIILDDGGYLIYWSNTLFKNMKNIVAIEQTSSGYVKLKDVKLNFPVLNVARSSAKLNLESPFIAEVAISKLKERLRNLKLNPKKVLIIGNGYIGDNILKVLSKDFEVRYYDVNQRISDLHKEEFLSKMGSFDMIIGCTGQQAIPQENIGRLKDGVILVSASSSDREFSASKLRKLIDKEKDCHRDLIIDGITLINSGFPVNFDGGEHSVSPNKIQLTRALIYSAVFLAVKIPFANEVIGLDKNLEESIVEEFKKYIH